MPVLSYDPKCVEGSGRTQDRADIMGVRHLVKHQDRPLVIASFFQHVAQPDVFQWLYFHHQPLMRGDRKSVVSGKSVSVRVDLGGRRIIKKKKIKINKIY